MRISHFQAIADILLGDAQSLARGYHEIANDTGSLFETKEARRRCLIAIESVALAVDPDRYRAALDALDARPRVEPVCDRCGSSELVRDACAEWDDTTQQWALVGVYDSTTCQTCEAENDSLCDWRTVAPESVQPPAAATTPSGDPDPSTRNRKG